METILKNSNQDVDESPFVQGQFFSPQLTEFANVHQSTELSFESKLIVGMKKLECKQY